MELEIKHTGRFVFLLMLLFAVVFSCSNPSEKSTMEQEIAVEAIDHSNHSDSTVESSATVSNPLEEDKHKTDFPVKPQYETKPTASKPTKPSSSSEEIDFSKLKGSGPFDESNVDWSVGSGHASSESTRTRLNNVNLEHLYIQETGKIRLRLEVDASGNVLRGTHVINKTNIEDTELIQNVIAAVIDQVKYKKTLDGKITFEYFTVYVK